MSSGEKVSLAKAFVLAGRIANLIGPYTEETKIAGSIRRKKAMVGDIEIVVKCEDDAQYQMWAVVDSLVNQGRVEKAEYGFKRSHRWGDRYRGMVYRDMLVEVFRADAHNWGYQLWLRTGGGEKNRYVMNRMKACQSPVRFADGYAWWVDYDSKHPNFDFDKGYARKGKLSVPDEATLYKLLGIHQVIEPERRSVRVYQGFLHNWVYCPSAGELRSMLVDEDRPPRQQSLF